MALVSCPECTNQVSDAAISCPHCGHPLQASPAAPTASPAAETTAAVAVPNPNEVKKELFEAGKSKFVLGEITSISQIKTRNWVWLVIGLPVIIAVIYAWTQLDWLSAGVITVAGFMILGFIYVDEGKIASTGNVTKFEDEMEQVSNRYQESLGKDNLIIYKSRNSFLDFSFSINPERVAEFREEKIFNHIWFYLGGIAAAAAASQMNIPLLYIVAAAIALLGFLTRKAALQVTGVGGATVNLYTRKGDIKTVIEQLTASLENRNTA